MPKTHLLQLRASQDFVKSLDNWRRKQTPIPSRSEAIRQLTTAGLKKS